MKFTTKMIFLFLSILLIKCTLKPKNLWKGNGKKMDTNLIRLIVEEHNKYRSDVAQGNLNNKSGKFPSAVNMNQLYWSEKLARKAQMLANKCSNKPSSEQFRAFAGNKVGENIFLKVSSRDVKPDLMEWEIVIKNWFEENSIFNIKDIQPFQITSQNTTNFTQIIWAKTEFVGCGYSAFKQENGDSGQLYVCHYSPGGNVVTKEIYIKGDVCSKCPPGYICKSEYEGLCCRDKFCLKGSLEIKNNNLR